MSYPLMSRNLSRNLKTLRELNRLCSRPRDLMDSGWTVSQSFRNLMILSTTVSITHTLSKMSLISTSLVLRTLRNGRWLSNLTIEHPKPRFTSMMTVEYCLHMRKTLWGADCTSDIIKTLTNLRRVNSLKNIRLSKYYQLAELKARLVLKWSKSTIRIWKIQLLKSDITSTDGPIDRALVL